MSTEFRVTDETTLGDLDHWIGLRPSITAARIRLPKGDQVKDYRAIFEIQNETPVLGDPANSLAEAIDSAVTHVEDLFPL